MTPADCGCDRLDATHCGGTCAPCTCVCHARPAPAPVDLNHTRAQLAGGLRRDEAADLRAELERVKAALESERSFSKAVEASSEAFRVAVCSGIARLRADLDAVEALGWQAIAERDQALAAGHTLTNLLLDQRAAARELRRERDEAVRLLSQSDATVCGDTLAKAAGRVTEALSLARREWDEARTEARNACNALYRAKDDAEAALNPWDKPWARRRELRRMHGACARHRRQRRKLLEKVRRAERAEDLVVGLRAQVADLRAQLTEALALAGTVDPAGAIESARGELRVAESQLRRSEELTWLAIVARDEAEQSREWWADECESVTKAAAAQEAEVAALLLALEAEREERARLEEGLLWIQGQADEHARGCEPCFCSVDDIRTAVDCALGDVGPEPATEAA